MINFLYTYRMLKRPFKKLKTWLSQKKQALFSNVHSVNDAHDVGHYLKTGNDAVALKVTPEQAQRLEDAHTTLKEILIRNGLYNDFAAHDMCAECIPGEPSKVREPDDVNLKFFYQTVTEQLPENERNSIASAKLNLVNVYRDIVEPGFDGKAFDIKFLPVTPGEIMHRHKAAFRFAAYSMGKPEETTEYPGMSENQRSPAHTALFFGGDFWHSSPESERPAILAESAPEKHF